MILIVTVVIVVTIRVDVLEGSRGTALSEIVFIEESFFEPFKLFFVFFVEDYGHPVYFLWVMRKQWFHKGVVKSIAEIGESMHDSYVIFMHLNSTLPLFMFRS